MSKPFRIGVSPDFYTDARGRFESVLQQKLAVEGVEWGPMPPLSGNVATPDSLDACDAVFALGIRITRESVVGLRRLALVARWGVGYDKIDVEALTEADVMLAITPDAVRTPVAEAILTLILALSKNLLTQDRIARLGKWRGDLPAMGRNVRGQVLGSVGFGNIAKEMFRLAKPFGFSRMLAFDPYVPVEAGETCGVELTTLETLLRVSDFVTINCLLNQETKGLIGERELKLMKRTAHLINTARGPIVHEQALTRALEDRWIAGAGVDVYESEPPQEDHPFFRMKNVIVAPHALAWTEELVRDNGCEACDNMLAISRGQLPGGIVNSEVTRRPGFQAKLRKYRGNA